MSHYHYGIGRLCNDSRCGDFEHVRQHGVPPHVHTAAGPDAQTPRTEEELRDWGHSEPGFFAGKEQIYVRADFARGLEREVADLRERAEAAEADAREARQDASNAAMDAVKHAKELAAERAIPRACRALEQDEVGAPCSYLRDAEAVIAAERAAREAAENSDMLTRSMLIAVERHLKFAERERDETGNLPRPTRGAAALSLENLLAAASESGARNGKAK